MASRSEPGPSTSVTNSDVGIFAPEGNIRTRDVTINHYKSSAKTEKFPLPQRIKTFHGREVEMRELDEAFFTQNFNKVVICGLGGFGKSELSKQFAHQCRVKEKVKDVVWIESDNPKDLKKSFKKLAYIYNKYAEKQLLIIFDNCVSQQSIADYEPSENKNHLILITSQYKLWKSDVKIIELQPLSPESAIEVFKSVLREKYKVEDEHSYASLASLVGCIPLGLQITAAYVEQGDKEFNLKEYVLEIEKSERDIINAVIPDCAETSYDKSIYGALITSLNKIKNKKDQTPQIRKLAHDMLCCSAYFHPDFIYVKDLLYQLDMIYNEACKDSEFKLALKLLINFSFLRYNHNDSYGYSANYGLCLAQHRTIQLFVLSYLNKSNLYSKYYKINLLLTLRTQNSTLRSFCFVESNKEIVYDFYKDNYMHKSIGWFIRQLVLFNCIECFKIIFKDPDEQTKKRIYQDNILALCATANNANMLKILLPYIDNNSTNENQDAALHVLATWGDIEGMKLLIHNGAVVNVCNKAGDSPLYTFIRGRHFIYNRSDWDNFFKAFKLKFNVKNSNNQTLLHAAVDGRHTELVDILIEKRLKLNQRDKAGWTPLDTLYNDISESSNPNKLISNNVKILKQLLRAGAKSKIKHTTRSGNACEYVLLEYALENDLDLMELLLHSGVDINIKNVFQQTILHRCCVTELNLKATQILVAHNANCNVTDFRGDTPLFYFVKYKVSYVEDMEVIKAMLHLLKCNPNQVDSSRNTVLHIAAQKRHVKLVEILLTNFKFNANQQNLAGDTPLHALVSSRKLYFSFYEYLNDQIKTIKMLKQHNARLGIKNKLKETPLHMLQRICHRECIVKSLRPHLTQTSTKVKNRKRKLHSNQ